MIPADELKLHGGRRWFCVDIGKRTVKRKLTVDDGGNRMSVKPFTEMIAEIVAMSDAELETELESGRMALTEPWRRSYDWHRFASILTEVRKRWRQVKADYVRQQ